MEPPPPLPNYNAHTSNKRVFSGGSSSFLDPEVVEIPPPPPKLRSSRSSKKKEVRSYEIIDLDAEEDADVIVIGEKVGTIDKGKGLQSYYNYQSNHQEKVQFGSNNPSGAQSSSKSGSHITVDLDFHSADASFGAVPSDFIVNDDDVTDLDMLALLQAHFDSVDFPTGVEAPISLFLDSSQNSKKSKGSSWDMKDPDLSCLKSTQMSSSNPGTVQTPSWPQLLTSQGLAASSQHGLAGQHFASGISTPSYHPFTGNFIPQPNSVASGSLFVGAINQPGPGNFSPMPPLWIPDMNFTGLFPSDPLNVVTNEGPHYPFSMGSFNSQENHGAGPATKTYDPTANSMNINDVLRNYELFKRFDVVEDCIGHYYANQISPGVQPPKAWSKRIMEEWKILEQDLPDMIFVRVYESRMELLRAVIIGAEGTPYHDGLFFFDVFFPRSYPNEPPKVHYHSGGLRLNPNLYNEGKVCLSLLNTWHGHGNERWVPGKSTMLQVLVSIQGLILNAEPYFNEPGYTRSYGTAKGKAESLKYNENTFFLSLKTMCYTIRNPPKHFEDLALGHFHKHAPDILAACKEYSDGAQVGSFVKGKAPSTDKGRKNSSLGFRKQLPQYIEMLVKDLTGIGVKDCDKFLHAANEQKQRKNCRASTSRTPSVGIKIGGSSSKLFGKEL